jgi:DNA-binding winged helix-turn-helix (wHTH) protein/predicted ATPase
MRRGRPGELPAVRLEMENEWAWCGPRRLELTPRAFAVLQHLMERAGRLVTKDELLTTLWRDAIVSDAALASCIRDLRKALRDTSEAPRYIETVHRRGFRFIGPIARATTSMSAVGARVPGSGADKQPAAGLVAGHGPTALVGRDAELGRLREWSEQALKGQRQLVFVTGEPGIGKTALVEALLAEIGETGALRIGRGQCVEQHGAGEPYLPVLEALGRLGRGVGGEQMVQILRQHAPTWLAQLSGLLADDELEAVQRRAHGATRERMLRELVEALEAVTRDAPLVLLLEDLHWSDSSTIDLLGMLARRRDSARLLVLGTYRPADVAGASHPLKPVKQELQVHGYCRELHLEFLSLSVVEQYLSRRFSGHGFPSELARVLHRNTDGNPLFLVSTIDYLIGQGQLREAGGHWGLAGPLEEIASRTPETLWQVVERQVERLTGEEQAMLALGSVAGAEFSAAVAAADGIDPHDAERRCDSLARRGQFVRAAGVAEWPDGTLAARYAFIHTLYQRALYARIPIGQRVGLHLRTGECLEGGYGERAGEIAGELAMHFERGRDYERAARYRRQAGERAMRQHANREAADHATQALQLLRALPDSPERIQQELALQIMLGAALTATQGYGAAEVARPYERARELCAQVGDTVRLLPVLLGIGRFHLSRGELQIARDVSTRLLSIADTTHDAAVGLAAHNAVGIMAFYAGEFEAALAHVEQSSRLYDPGQHSPNRSATFRAGQDPGVWCAVYAAWTLQLLGHPARAAARMREALALARSLDHPFSVVYACHFAASFHLYRRERDAVQELEDESLAYATEHGFRLFPLMGAIHHGWVLSEQARGENALAQMREGLAALRAIGIEFRRPGFLALVAEVCEKVNQPGEGLSAVAEALAAAEHTGQRYWDAELHRLKGMLTRQSDAEACFLEAIRIAQRQRAKSLELRAATSLSRLWATKGKASEAHALLSAIYAEFTEGFDTADLSDAKSLLEQLERRARTSRADEAGRKG